MSPVVVVVVPEVVSVVVDELEVVVVIPVAAVVEEPESPQAATSRVIAEARRMSRRMMPKAKTFLLWRKTEWLGPLAIFWVELVFEI